MNLLYKRPLLSVSLCGVVIGLLLARASALVGLILAGLVGAAFLCFLILLLCRKSPNVLLVLTLSLAIPLLSSLWHVHRPQARAEETPAHTVIEAKVLSATNTDSDTRLTLQIRFVDGERVFFRAFCRLDDPADINAEDTVRLVGDLNPIYQDHSESREHSLGLFVAVEEVEAWSVTGRAFSLRARLDAVRDTLAASMEEDYAAQGGSLLPSLLLGARDNLPSYATLAFRRLGLSHVLALSGLHLSILCAGFYALAKRCRLSARTARLACAVFVVGYTLLVGASPSIVRSALMTLCAVWAFRSGHSPDSYTSLWVAGLFIVTVSPGAVYDIGFWLSILATMGILVAVSSQVGAKLRKRRWAALLLYPLLLTVSATVATLLPTAILFGEISWISPLANLLLAPVLPPLIYLAFFHLLVSPIPYVGKAVGTALSVLCEGLLYLIDQVASIPNLMISLRALPIKIGVVLCFGLLVCLLLLPFGKRFFGYGSAICLVAVFALAAGIQIHSVRTAWIQYGVTERNDHLLCSDGTKQVLILSDNGAYFSVSGARTAMTERHLAELDALVLTHCHIGHASALRPLLSGVKVHVLYLPEAHTLQELVILEAIAETAQACRVPLRFYKEGEVVPLGEWDYTLIEGSHTDRMAYTLSGMEQEICYVSASYLASGEGDALARALFRAHTLILSPHGKWGEGILYLPLLPAVERVVVPYSVEYALSLPAGVPIPTMGIENWDYRIDSGKERYTFPAP